MGFWSGSTPYSVATGERLGPLFDLFVGTEGRTADLFAAYTTYSARRIFLTPGATLSADLTIAANDVLIFAPCHCESIDLGAHKLIISGQRVFLAGFKINGATGIGIDITGSANLERVAVYSCTSHGIRVASGSQNDMNFDRVISRSNGGDGLSIVSGGGNHSNIRGGLYFGNTGYGINDGLNSAIIVGNRVASNTAGQINGSPSVNTGNKLT